MSTASLKTLPNGLRVVLVPCEAESVAFGLFIASGSRHEDAKTAGISHFIEHMLFKGTPKRKPIDITRAIEGRGGNFNACTSEESTIYYTHMPYEYLGEAIDILSDMYLNASIPADEFKREKQVVIEEIKMYADDPDSVAMENLQRSLYPQDPLGAPTAGTPESLALMQPADLKAYVKSHYTADKTVAVVVGRFDEAEALKLIDRSLGGVPKASEVKGGKRSKKGGFGTVISEITTTKDVQQAQLALGFRTFGLSDPRKYAATVMDAILGRGMSSRLFQEVREKRGLSYDIGSRMPFFSDTGMFLIQAGLDASKREATLKTIDRELAKICAKKVSAAELKRTKDFLCGNFRLSHERVLSKLFFFGSTILAFGRLISTEEQVEGIRGVTSDDILSVANDIFKPENRSISWVLPK